MGRSMRGPWSGIIGLVLAIYVARTAASSKLDTLELFWDKYNQYHFISYNKPTFSIGHQRENVLLLNNYRDTFKIHNGLTGEFGTVSIQSSKNPELYLRRVGNQLRLKKYENNNAYKNEATFYVRVDKWFEGYFALEITHMPDTYVRHLGNRLYIQKYDKSNRFAADASFLQARISEPVGLESFDQHTKYWGVKRRNLHLLNIGQRFQIMSPGFHGHYRGETVSFLLPKSHGVFLQHTRNKVFARFARNSDTFRDKATFNVFLNKWAIGFAAFQPLLDKTKYLTHRGLKKKLRVATYTGTRSFKAQSSFAIRGFIIHGKNRPEIKKKPPQRTLPVKINTRKNIPKNKIQILIRKDRKTKPTIIKLNKKLIIKKVIIVVNKKKKITINTQKKGKSILITRKNIRKYILIKLIGKNGKVIKRLIVRRRRKKLTPMKVQRNKAGRKNKNVVIKIIGKNNKVQNTLTFKKTKNGPTKLTFVGPRGRRASISIGKQGYTVRIYRPRYYTNQFFRIYRFKGRRRQGNAIKIRGLRRRKYYPYKLRATRGKTITVRVIGYRGRQLRQYRFSKTKRGPTKLLMVGPKGRRASLNIGKRGYNVFIYRPRYYTNQYFKLYRYKGRKLQGRAIRIPGLRRRKSYPYKLRATKGKTITVRVIGYRGRQLRQYRFSKTKAGPTRLLMVGPKGRRASLNIGKRGYNVYIYRPRYYTNQYFRLYRYKGKKLQGRAIRIPGLRRRKSYPYKLRATKGKTITVRVIGYRGRQLRQYRFSKTKAGPTRLLMVGPKGRRASLNIGKRGYNVYIYRPRYYTNQYFRLYRYKGKKLQGRAIRIPGLRRRKSYPYKLRATKGKTITVRVIGYRGRQLRQYRFSKTKAGPTRLLMVGPKGRRASLNIGKRGYNVYIYRPRYYTNQYFRLYRYKGKKLQGRAIRIPGLRRRKSYPYKLRATKGKTITVRVIGYRGRQLRQYRFSKTKAGPTRLLMVGPKGRRASLNIGKRGYNVYIYRPRYYTNQYFRLYRYKGKKLQGRAIRIPGLRRRKSYPYKLRATKGKTITVRVIGYRGRQLRQYRFSKTKAGPTRLLMVGPKGRRASLNIGKRGYNVYIYRPRYYTNQYFRLYRYKGKKLQGRAIRIPGLRRRKSYPYKLRATKGKTITVRVIGYRGRQLRQYRFSKTKAGPTRLLMVGPKGRRASLNIGKRGYNVYIYRPRYYTNQYFRLYRYKGKKLQGRAIRIPGLRRRKSYPYKLRATKGKTITVRVIGYRGRQLRQYRFSKTKAGPTRLLMVGPKGRRASLNIGKRGYNVYIYRPRYYTNQYFRLYRYKGKKLQGRAIRIPGLRRRKSYPYKLRATKGKTITVRVIGYRGRQLRQYRFSKTKAGPTRLLMVGPKGRRASLNIGKRGYNVYIYRPRYYTNQYFRLYRYKGKKLQGRAIRIPGLRRRKSYPYKLRATKGKTITVRVIGYRGRQLRQYRFSKTKAGPTRLLMVGPKGRRASLNIGKRGYNVYIYRPRYYTNQYFRLYRYKGKKLQGRAIRIPGLRRRKSYPYKLRATKGKTITVRVIGYRGRQLRQYRFSKTKAGPTRLLMVGPKGRRASLNIGKRGYNVYIYRPRYYTNQYFRLYRYKGRKLQGGSIRIPGLRRRKSYPYKLRATKGKTITVRVIGYRGRQLRQYRFSKTKAGPTRLLMVGPKGRRASLNIGKRGYNVYIYRPRYYTNQYFRLYRYKGKKLQGRAIRIPGLRRRKSYPYKLRATKGKTITVRVIGYRGRQLRQYRFSKTKAGPTRLLMVGPKGRRASLNIGKRGYNVYIYRPRYYTNQYFRLYRYKGKKLQGRAIRIPGLRRRKSYPYKLRATKGKTITVRVIGYRGRQLRQYRFSKTKAGPTRLLMVGPKGRRASLNIGKRGYNVYIYRPRYYTNQYFRLYRYKGKKLQGRAIRIPGLRRRKSYPYKLRATKGKTITVRVIGYRGRQLRQYRFSKTKAGPTRLLMVGPKGRRASLNIGKRGYNVYIYRPRYYTNQYFRLYRYKGKKLQGRAIRIPGLRRRKISALQFVPKRGKNPKGPITVVILGKKKKLPKIMKFDDPKKVKKIKIIGLKGGSKVLPVGGKGYRVFVRRALYYNTKMVRIIVYKTNGKTATLTFKGLKAKKVKSLIPFTVIRQGKNVKGPVRIILKNKKGKTERNINASSLKGANKIVLQSGKFRKVIKITQRKTDIRVYRRWIKKTVLIKIYNNKNKVMKAYNYEKNAGSQKRSFTVIKQKGKGQTRIVAIDKNGNIKKEWKLKPSKKLAKIMLYRKGKKKVLLIRKARYVVYVWLKHVKNNFKIRIQNIKGKISKTLSVKTVKVLKHIKKKIKTVKVLKHIKKKIKTVKAHLPNPFEIIKAGSKNKPPAKKPKKNAKIFNVLKKVSKAVKKKIAKVVYAHGSDKLSKPPFQISVGKKG